MIKYKTWVIRESFVKRNLNRIIFLCSLVSTIETVERTIAGYRVSRHGTIYEPVFPFCARPLQVSATLDQQAFNLPLMFFRKHSAAMGESTEAENTPCLPVVSDRMTAYMYSCCNEEEQREKERERCV